jgi:hypothetical protein
MANRFSAEAEFSANYAGVSASAGAQYSQDAVFKSTHMYAVYSYDQRLYWVRFDQTWYDHFDSDFIDKAEKLPVWKLDRGTYNKYFDFFEEWGTHLIMKCHAGTRCHLKDEQAESSEERVEDFKANVKVAYKGLFGLDLTYTNKKEWESYQKMHKKVLRVLGGDNDKAGKLGNNPTQKNFEEWAASREKNKHSLVHAEIQSIGTLLSKSPIESLRELAKDRLSPAIAYASNFITLEGIIWVSQINVQKAWESVDCSIDLPGLVIKAGNVSDMHIEQGGNTPWKLKATRQGNTTVAIPVIIRAPIHPVEVVVKFSGGHAGPGAGFQFALLLSPFTTKGKDSVGWRTDISIAVVEGGTISAPSLAAWGVYNPFHQNYGSSGKVSHEEAASRLPELRELMVE